MPPPALQDGFHANNTNQLTVGDAWPLVYLQGCHPHILCDSVYFIEYTQNGEPDVFCWSCSLHGDDQESYIWRVFASNSGIVFELRWHMKHSDFLYTWGSYILCVHPAGQRQIFRATLGPTAIVCLHAVDLFVDLLPLVHIPRDHPLAYTTDWNASGLEPLGELPGQVSHLAETDNTTSGMIGFESIGYSSIDPTLIDSSESNPTFHDSSVQAEVPGNSLASMPSTNAAVSETYQSIYSASQSTHAQPSENPLMRVPPGLNTRRLINDFVGRYTSMLPKLIREVCCSLCQGGPDSDKLWEVKPSNLTRHIMSHNGVRWYQCHISDCPKGPPQFTTKDQGKVHLEKYHGEPVNKLIELDLDLVFQLPGAACT